MKHLSGFTLLIVLIFLQVFALLTLNSLSQAAMLTKANFDQYQANNLLGLTQAMLLKLEKQIPHDCMIASLPAANLARRSLAWWEVHACRKTQENQTFYYVLEFLGRDLCCFITPNTSNNITPVEFYRLSLYVAHRQTEILLQSTIALPGRAKPVCQTKPHFIAPGRQMYREIK